MYEWCMNDVYMARPAKIVIVLSVLPNWNKIDSQSVSQIQFSQMKWVKT